MHRGRVRSSPRSIIKDTDVEIDKLYEELGRTISQNAKARRQYTIDRDAVYSKREQLDKDANRLVEKFRKDRSKYEERATLLQEAIRMAEDEGVDPLLAKLTADQEMERRQNKQVEDEQDDVDELYSEEDEDEDCWDEEEEEEDDDIDFHKIMKF
jgi:hypothetical protein